jgi:hypothetical protein
LPPEGVLRESGINSYVIGVVTNVNIKVTNRFVAGKGHNGA